MTKRRERMVCRLQNRRCRIEQLERRCLLAAEIVNITSDATVERNQDNVQVIEAGSTLLDTPISELDSLQIQGDPSDNQVTLDFRSGEIIPSGGLRVDAGGGNDTLRIAGDIVLDLRYSGPAHASDIETIDLTDPGAQIITLDASAVRSLAPGGRLDSRAGVEDELVFGDAAFWRMTSAIEAGAFVQTARQQVTGEVIQVDSDTNFHNFVVAGDVNNDGNVTAQDAIGIINELTRRSVSSEIDGQVVDPATLDPFQGIYPDQNGDNVVSALDALRVINVIARETFALPSGPVNIALTSNDGVQHNPSVAVNPNDADHVVVAYMDYSLVDTGYAGIGVTVSRDGGKSWTTSQVPVSEDFNEGASNPVARFDDQGRVYVSYMAATFLGEKPPIMNPNFFNPEGSASDRDRGMTANNGVFVSRSDNGGTLWNEPAVVISQLYDGQTEVPFEINPEIAIDLNENLPSGEANPNFGNLYAVWARLYPQGQFPGESEPTGGSDLFVAVSTDGGVSWESQFEQRDGLQRSNIRLDVTEPDVNTGSFGGPAGIGFLDQPHLAVGPSGEIYLSSFTGGNFGVHLSTDAGKSFTPPSIETGDRIVFSTDFSTQVNSDGLPNNRFRTHAARAIVSDPVRGGNVYASDVISVSDARGRELDPADVFFSRSVDQGGDWAGNTVEEVEPALQNPNGSTLLNDDNASRRPTGDPLDVISGQAAPRMAIDAQGNIGLIWYDTRRDPADHLLDVFATISYDGGETFTPNFRLTSQSFDADEGSFTNAVGEEEFYLGDAIGLAMTDNVAYAAWTDTRSGNQDIVVTRFSIDNPLVPLNDRFEPNDQPQPETVPTNVGTVVKRFLPQLNAAPGDEDWYRVEAAADGDLIATILLDEPRSDEVELQIWDRSATTLLTVGQTVVDASTQLTSIESRYLASTGEQLLIRVSGADVSEVGGGVSYALQLQSLTEDLGTPVTANIAGTVSVTDSLLYLVTAPATGSLEVRLAGQANVQGTLLMDVLNAQSLKTIISASVTTSSSQLLSIPARQGESFLLKIAGESSSVGDFDLDIRNLDAFSTPNVEKLLFPIGGGPSQAAVGDLNQDGNLDSVVVSALSNRISVLLGNGDGTLPAAREYEIGAFTRPLSDVSAELPTFGRDIAIADFNGDDVPDLIATNFASSDVSLLLGRGDGTFEPQRRFDASPAPYDLVVDDVNNDSNLDVIVIETATGKSEVTIATLLGRGDGTFDRQLTTKIAISANNNGTIRLADLDEDGAADLIVSGDGGLAQVTILRGNGDGTFTQSDNYVAGITAVALATADVNRDGHTDVIAVDFDTTGNVHVLLGNGDGTLQPSLQFFGGQGATAVEVADVGSPVENPDGSIVLGPPDGRLDLIVANSGATRAISAVGGPEVVVLAGLVNDQDEFSGFAEPIQFSGGDAPLDVDLGDFNGDGATDIAVVDQGGLLVVYGEPLSASTQSTRDLGTIVHHVDQTQTIVPGREEAFYKFTVPTEVATDANQVVDVSMLFEHTEGPGLAAELRDSGGNLLGSGERFRGRAKQGEELTLHVFGVEDNGQIGYGAFTPVINVLPQVVFVEAQALLPGVGDSPGGPTTSIVLTLQGDRLDRNSAEETANYTITAFGGDRLSGTADDVQIPIADIVYSPSTNIDVSTGKTFPTAVRQTITLEFASALPAGSYQIEIDDVVTEPFNQQEAGLLADTETFGNHPLVSLDGGHLSDDVSVTAIDLVMASEDLGDVSAAFKAGTPFLTQLHDDLAALLDATLTEIGDASEVTDELLSQMLSRLLPSIGPRGERSTSIMALFIDPAIIDIEDSEGEIIFNDPGDPAPVVTDDDCFVEVSGNIEVVICNILDPFIEFFELAVTETPETVRGGIILIGPDTEIIDNITDELRDGVEDFTIEFPDGME